MRRFSTIIKGGRGSAPLPACTRDHLHSGPPHTHTQTERTSHPSILKTTQAGIHESAVLTHLGIAPADEVQQRQQWSGGAAGQLLYRGVYKVKQRRALTQEILEAFQVPGAVILRTHQGATLVQCCVATVISCQHKYL